MEYSAWIAGGLCLDSPSGSTPRAGFYPRTLIFNSIPIDPIHSLAGGVNRPSPITGSKTGFKAERGSCQVQGEQGAGANYGPQVGPMQSR